MNLTQRKPISTCRLANLVRDSYNHLRWHLRWRHGSRPDGWVLYPAHRVQPELSIRTASAAAQRKYDQ